MDVAGGLKCSPMVSSVVIWHVVAQSMVVIGTVDAEGEMLGVQGRIVEGRGEESQYF